MESLELSLWMEKLLHLAVVIQKLSLGSSLECFSDKDNTWGCLAVLWKQKHKKKEPGLCRVWVSIHYKQQVRQEWLVSLQFHECGPSSGIGAASTWVAPLAAPFSLLWFLGCMSLFLHFGTWTFDLGITSFHPLFYSIFYSHREKGLLRTERCLCTTYIVS